MDSRGKFMKNPVQKDMRALNRKIRLQFADRVARKLFDEDQQAKLALLPLLFTMILYSCFNVWLITQPKDMRASGM